MTVTAITAELQVANTRSSDYPFIAGGGSGNAIVATSATDGWVVSPPSGGVLDGYLLFILGSDGSGGTVTFKKGVRYPAHRVDLGDEIITLAPNDGRTVQVETSRFLQDDGTIDVIPSTTGLVLTAIVMAKGP